MKCQFCKQEVKRWDMKCTTYVIASKHIGHTKEGDPIIHVHGHISNTNAMRELVRKIIKECRLTQFFMEVST
jgi:hypothetical protein